MLDKRREGASKGLAGGNGVNVSRFRGGGPGFSESLEDFGEDGVGDLGLFLQGEGEGRGVRGQEGHLVGVGGEAAPRLPDVVGADEVAVFFPEFQKKSCLFQCLRNIPLKSF